MLYSFTFENENYKIDNDDHYERWRASMIVIICRLLAALARAFLKNPGILLCDEATSALDSRTEKQILHALTTLAQGRTSVFIAHRLSTAAQCDQVGPLPGVLCKWRVLHSAQRLQEDT